jgi:hypothetical protein
VVFKYGRLRDGGWAWGLTTLRYKKENYWKASKKFSRILWRRPRPKLGYGAKEEEEDCIASTVRRHDV